MIPLFFWFLVVLLLINPLMPQSASASPEIPGDNTNKSVIQDYSIRVVIDQIYISKKGDYLEVSEFVVFRNDGPGIFYDHVNHTYFAVSIPEGVENLETNAMECCLVQYEDTVFMDPMNPVNPGDSFDMKISYSLFTENQDYKFDKAVVYNTTSLSVFVNKKGGIGTGKGFSTITIHGNDFEVISFQNLAEGDKITIPLQMAGKSNRYGIAGVIFLVLIAIFSGFKYIKYRTGRKDTLEKLEQEKTRIFRIIHGFEKHAGSEESGEYRILMDEYRQKAIEILIKIDKIKSKEVENIRGITGRTGE